MKCPFLQEQRVKFCTVGPYRKPIVESSADTASELCSSRAHLGCRQAQAAMGLTASEADPERARCPYLADSLVEYCSATSVPRFVPFNDSELARCRRPAYRYCDLFLTLSRSRAEQGTGFADHPESIVDGIEVPPHLCYSRNHMWLDKTSPGSCQIGIDGFMAVVLGQVDQVTFLNTRGTSRPTVILTVKGVDLPVVFPCRVPIRAANLYLRAEPERLTAEPYASGWLFEGGEVAPGEPDPEEVLLPGNEAGEWIQGECDRLSALVHEQLQGPSPGGYGILNDGGSFVHGLCGHLTRDQVLSLFNEFFSPYLNGARR
jgi:glycine cleavage system H lipoate-binding protein